MGKGEAEPKKTVARVGRKPRVSKDVMEHRVNAVYGWLVAGQRGARIYAAILAAAKFERERRAEALAAEPPKARPRFVWGDDNPPCGPRTAENYIAKAKERLELEGRELPKQGAQVLGLTWARLNDLYGRALADKRYTVCRQLIRDGAEIFGLVGAIKFQFVDPGASTGAPAGGDTSHLGESEYTTDQLERAWQELMTEAVTRYRAAGSPPALKAGPTPELARAIAADVVDRDD